MAGSDTIRLTQTVTGSGCASKLPSALLDRALCGLEIPTDPNVLVGLTRADDAGVYKITDDIAMIQTVDFFTPVVDDPYQFGQIAAANALSDVYAMGGVPKTALNLVAFPSRQMDLSILRRIIEGGLNKMIEAGVVLLGGHSVEDKEIKYGLAVTGFIHPDHILTKKNLRKGDLLVLTKPLGVGIINTAMKGGLVSEACIERVVRQMATLNKYAADIMAHYSVSACTDITGFGLLGHLAEMVDGSEYSVHLKAGQVPFIPEALEFARMGFIPGGAYRNREFREPMIDMSPSMDRIVQHILFDPQTSGGLLICVVPEQADMLLNELKDNGMTDSAVIGEVGAGPAQKIIVD